jgi:hypothetical protein
MPFTPFYNAIILVAASSSNKTAGRVLALRQEDNETAVTAREPTIPLADVIVFRWGRAFRALGVIVF